MGRFRVTDTDVLYVPDDAQRTFILRRRKYRPTCPRCGGAARVVKIIHKGRVWCDECDYRPWRNV